LQFFFAFFLRLLRGLRRRVFMEWRFDGWMDGWMDGLMGEWIGLYR